MCRRLPRMLNIAVHSDISFPLSHFYVYVANDIIDALFFPEIAVLLVEQ